MVVLQGKQACGKIIKEFHQYWIFSDEFDLLKNKAHLQNKSTVYYK